MSDPAEPPVWVVATEEYERHRDSEYRDGSLYGPFDSEDAAWHWLVGATHERRLWEGDELLDPWDWARVRRLDVDDYDDEMEKPYLVGDELGAALLEYVEKRRAESPTTTALNT